MFSPRGHCPGPVCDAGSGQCPRSRGGAPGSVIYSSFPWIHSVSAPCSRPEQSPGVRLGFHAGPCSRLGCDRHSPAELPGQPQAPSAPSKPHSRKSVSKAEMTGRKKPRHVLKESVPRSGGDRLGNHSLLVWGFTSTCTREQSQTVVTQGINAVRDSSDKGQGQQSPFGFRRRTSVLRKSSGPPRFWQGLGPRENLGKGWSQGSVPRCQGGHECPCTDGGGWAGTAGMLPVPITAPAPCSCSSATPAPALPCSCVSAALTSLPMAPGAPGFQVPKTFCSHSIFPLESHFYLQARYISQQTTQCKANEN